MKSVFETRSAVRSAARRSLGPSLAMLATVLFAFCCFSALPGSLARAQSAAQRVVEGKVLGSGDEPLSEAVVYLKDGRTNTIKTGITTADGKYRFGQLSSDTDYSLWAQYQGKKSGTKSISSFDSKKQFFINLKVDTGK
jgi:Carboxypeptidase regulatory-like domain